MSWDIQQAKELYGVDRWGNGYFDVNASGEVVVNLRDGDKSVPVSLNRVVQEMKERGWALPMLMRFRDLLDTRIEELNESFNSAIENSGYKG